MRKAILVKQEKAITMITLVITIIILLILAGVSIAMLTVENGILTKAIEAKNKTANAEKEEKEILENYEITLNEISSSTTISNTNDEEENNTKQIYTIPEITNTNDPSVFASGYFNYANGYYPSRAFDKITTGGSIQEGFNDSPWAQKSSSNVYIGYAYGIPVKVTKAEYTPRYDNQALTQNLKEYKYQYSDDFSTWNDATETIILDNYDFTDPVVTDINDCGTHRFWRLYIISNFGNEYTAVNELQFYCTI